MPRIRTLAADDTIKIDLGNGLKLEGVVYKGTFPGSDGTKYGNFRVPGQGRNIGNLQGMLIAKGAKNIKSINSTTLAFAVAEKDLKNFGVSARMTAAQES